MPSTPVGSLFSDKRHFSLMINGRTDSEEKSVFPLKVAPIRLAEFFHHLSHYRVRLVLVVRQPGEVFT